MPEGTVATTGAVQTGVFDRAFMLVLEFTRFGTSRKAGLGSVTVNADKDLLRLSKRLLKCEQYDAILSHDRETKKWVEDLALSFPIQRGSYLIPMPVLGEVIEYLQGREAEREALVASFIDVYPAEVEKMADELRDLYNARDYPSPAEVREKFSMHFQVLDYGVPGRLRHLNQSLFEAEQAKVQVRITEATNEIQQALRASLLKLTEHLVERLKPSDDGKKKIFRDSAIESVQEFLGSFDVRNITNDADLASVVERARSIISGVTPDALRSNEALRDAVAGQFAQIQTSLDTLVTNRPVRRIEFEDDEVATDAAETQSVESVA